jgi:glycerol uptake facilitator-like aquaporin
MKPEKTGARAVAAEALGSLILLAAIVGSGIMASRLSLDGAVQLFCTTLATAAALFVLILLFAPVSGAHFNPLVSVCAVLNRALRPRAALAYMVAQALGAVAGVCLAHAMFGAPFFTWGNTARHGSGLWLSEGVATFGLILTIAGTTQRGPETGAAAVALYIAAAYWFTASTSFANPAVTLARAFTASLTGIRPADVTGFVAAQCAGAFVGFVAGRMLFPGRALTSGG